MAAARPVDPGGEARAVPASDPAPAHAGIGRGGGETNTAVWLQAALNGARTRAEHPAVPSSAADLVRDAVACVAAGARGIHLHPRDGDGRETLDPAVVDAVSAAVRAACGVPVSVTTGAWIEPDPGRREALVRGWSAPDSASVNMDEPGAVAVIRALLGRGIGAEPGVATVDGVGLLVASGLADRCLRVLIEPVEPAPADALATAAAIHAALDRHAIALPRLQHGIEAAAWAVLRDAAARGVPTRIGLEDTTTGPGGEAAAGNEPLVRAAVAVLAGA